MGIKSKNIRISFIVFGDILAISFSYVAAYVIRFGSLGGGSE